jgi:thiamine biosynthesis protein ThiS
VSISLTINGKPRQLPAELTLPALLHELGVDRRLVAVAVNGDVLKRDRYDAVCIKDGDVIEIVRMVGGG